MRYIIYCGPGIGDFVLILPMAKAIKEFDNNSYIKAVMTSSNKRFGITKELLQIQSFIDEIDYYSFSEKKKAVSFLLKNGIKTFDEGYVLQYTNDDNTSIWPSRLIRIAAKKTFGIETNSKSIKYDFEIKREEGCRIVNYTKKLLTLSGKDAEFVESGQLLDKEKIKSKSPSWYQKSGKKLITLCLGTANVSRMINGVLHQANPKQWPYEYWVNLAYLLKNNGYEIFLIGGQKEKKELDNAGIMIKEEGIVDGIGKCEIIESLGVLANSDLVIGCDTGIMHCAGALGISNLTLFGCTDWREYLPFGSKSEYIQSEMKCSPCFGTDKSVMCSYYYECMKTIKPNFVFEKALEILSRNLQQKNQSEMLNDGDQL